MNTTDMERRGITESMLINRLMDWVVKLEAADTKLNAAIERQGGATVSAAAVREEMQAVRRLTAEIIFDLWIATPIAVELEDTRHEDHGGFEVRLSSEELDVEAYGFSVGAPAAALCEAIELIVADLDSGRPDSDTPDDGA